MFNTHAGYLPAYDVPAFDFDAELEAMSIEERNEALDQFRTDFAEWDDDRAERYAAEQFDEMAYEVAA